MCSALLTMNNDLSLENFCSFHASNIADVWSRVCDVDIVDGQDLNRLCGMRQRFSLGLGLHPAICLSRRNTLWVLLGTSWNIQLLTVASAGYLFTGIRPLDVHPGVELHCRRAVQGESLPHHQLYRFLRKQLDFVNFTSCSGKRGKKTEKIGSEAAGEVTVTSSAAFFCPPHRPGGNDFLLNQRSHATIKGRPVTTLHYFHSCDKLLLGEIKVEYSKV